VVVYGASRDIEGDTIAAIITAPGIGAMGALRLSGPLAFDAVSRIFRRKNGGSMEALSDYSLTYGGVYLDGVFLDQALMLKMKAPHSFTGEDVAELQCHGGPLVMGRLLAAVTSLDGLPVRAAAPGEFSLRAFLQGKMDLSQAEAVMELVSADNPKAALLAAEQIGGGLSLQLNMLKSKIMDLLAEIEVEVDFPDEDLGVASAEASRREKFRNLLEETDGILAMAERGRIYRDGIRAVFFGRPNAGKSSLLNGLLREPRAIVTPEPGTTRDVLEERVVLKGVPLLLTDTAGVRKVGSLAEQAGVERARQAAVKADLILYIVDVTAGLTDEDEAFLRELAREKTLIIFNKTDLLDRHPDEVVEALLPEEFGEWLYCCLSALESSGLEILAERIAAFFQQGGCPSREIVSGQSREILLNHRQSEALLKVRQALASALNALDEGMPEDIASIDLRQAWACIGELTGETAQPALVEAIFSKFCLGK
jgi:tRNA modification GTPase